MKRPILPLLALVVLGGVGTDSSQPGEQIVIRAARVIDGRGNVDSSPAAFTVQGSKIAGPCFDCTPDIDLGNLTLLPGFIDTHVHIGWHFGPDGRYVAGNEPPDVTLRYGAINARLTLMAGFTTVQSVGANSDKPLRMRLPVVR